MLGPSTRLQGGPPTFGGAAAVIVSENFARRKCIRADIVIRGQAMRTDFPSTFEENSLIKVVGADLSAVAAKSVYEQSGISPADVDVFDLHHSFTSNELGSASCMESVFQSVLILVAHLLL